MPRRDSPDFEVLTRADGTTCVVTVRGELDIGSAATLRETLLRLLQDEPVPDIALEASGLTFIDSSGLAVLLMAARRWDAVGCAFVLRSPSDTLTRIVDLTGVRRAFSFEDED